MYYKTYIDDVDIYYFNSSSLFHYVFINQNDIFNIINTNMSFHDHYIYGPCYLSDVGDKKIF